MTLASSVNDVIYGEAPFGSLVGVFDEQDELIWALGFLVFLLGAYFIPTAVAFSRDVRSRWLVAVINTFLGWTLVGWMVAGGGASIGSPSERTTANPLGLACPAGTCSHDAHPTADRVAIAPDSLHVSGPAEEV